MAKNNELIKEYRKQRKRVLAGFRAVIKEGFKPSLNIPKIPKRITQKSIDYLSKITRDRIRKTSKYFEFNDLEDPEVTYVVSAKKGIKLRKEYAKRKRAEKRYGNFIEDVSQEIEIMSLDEQYQMVIDDYTSLITSYLTAGTANHVESYNICNSWLMHSISENGVPEVAKALEAGYKRHDWLSIQEAYNVELTHSAVRDMAEILNMPDSEKIKLYRNLSEMSSEGFE